MTGEFEVKWVSKGLYAVFRDGVQVTGKLDRSRAEERATKLAYQAKGSMRACITCRRQFQSEGAHNRMCDPCRDAAGRAGPFGTPGVVYRIRSTRKLGGHG